VVDVLRGELARRYHRDGTAQVSQLSRVLIVDDDPAIRRVVSALLDLDEIADGAGSQFDPMVVDAFTTIVPDLPGLHASLHTGGPTPGPHTGGPTPGLWTA
jgi:response regulator RpfG family c-di-GMP phosphodiesterase